MQSNLELDLAGLSWDVLAVCCMRVVSFRTRFRRRVERQRRRPPVFPLRNTDAVVGDAQPSCSLEQVEVFHNNHPKKMLSYRWDVE